MRAGWKTITLNEACIQMNGIWKGTKEPLVPAKVLRTTNFSKDCRIKLDDLAIIDVEKKKLDARRLQRGDIIVEKSGGGPKQPVGRVILFDMDDDDYSFCNFTSALRIKDKEQLDYNYLHKYLIYLYFEGKTEKYQSNLVGFRNLDFKGYVGIEVPYPSLPEQQHIVAVLDREFAKIDTLKANAKKSLQAAKDLFVMLLDTTFDRIESAEPLGHLVSIINGYAFKSEDFNKFNPVKSIKITNVGTGEFVETEDANLPQSFLDEKKEFAVHSGDIVFALTRTVIAGGLKVAIIPESYNNALLNQRVAAISVDNVIQRQYLFYFFQTTFVKNYILKNVNTLMQPNLSVKDLRAMPVKVSKSNQQTMPWVVSFLNTCGADCRKIQENYQKTLALCDDLKQSLLRKAFNGEL